MCETPSLTPPSIDLLNNQGQGQAAGPKPADWVQPGRPPSWRVGGVRSEVPKKDSAKKGPPTKVQGPAGPSI